MLVFMMNLIFMYGPPAVGKLTVASLLAEQTGYRLFHNHLTVPAANAIFPVEGPARTRYLQDQRILGIQAAAENGVDLIFTAAYSGHEKDGSFMQRIIDTVTATGGRMMYVQLFAPMDVLLQRVTAESRKELGLEKMTDPNTYMDRLRRKQRDIMVSVPYGGVLKLDTSQLTPPESVEEIVRHFGL